MFVTVVPSEQIFSSWSPVRLFARLTLQPRQTGSEERTTLHSPVQDDPAVLSGVGRTVADLCGLTVMCSFPVDMVSCLVRVIHRERPPPRRPHNAGRIFFRQTRQSVDLRDRVNRTESGDAGTRCGFVPFQPERRLRCPPANVTATQNQSGGRASSAL